MLKQELYKMLYKQKGILLILVFCVIKIITSYFGENGKYVNIDIERNRNTYSSYIEQIEGKISTQKEQYIQQQMNDYEDVQEKSFCAADDLLKQKITMKEYLLLIKQYENVLEKREVIDALYSQYNYVKESPENRYFMYQNGWIYLFSHMQLDWILYSMLFILITPVFCMEYDTKMDSLNLICRNGRGQLFVSKMFAAGVVVLLAVVLFYGIEIINAHIKFGLNNMEFPINSIVYLEDQTLPISLGGMLVFILGIKLIGAFFFASLLLMSSLICKKVMRTIFFSIFVIAAPYFLLSEIERMKYPFLIDYMMQKAYVGGVFDSTTGVMKTLSIEEVKSSCFHIMITIFVLTCISFIIYNRGVIYIKKIRGFLICATICLCLICTGCNKTEYSTIGQLNYSVMNYYFENNDYMVDSCVVPYKLIDKKSGKEMSLFHDAFLAKEDYEMIKIEYMTEELLFYVVRYELGDYEIKQMNLKTFDEDVIYERLKYHARGKNFMNLKNESLKPGKEAHLEISESKLQHFWVKGEKLYLLEGEVLSEVDLGSRKKTILIKGISNGAVSVDNDTLYYIDTYYLLHQYNIVNKIDSVINEELAWSMRTTKGYLVIQGADGCIYIYDKQSGKDKKIAEGGVTLADLTDDRVYYILDEKKIYSVDYSGENEEYVYQSDRMVQQFKCFSNTEECMIATIGDDLSAPPETIVISR